MTHDEIKLDIEREQRLGFGEAVFCQDKSAQQIVAILETAAAAGTPLLLTRLRSDVMTAVPRSLAVELDFDPASRTGFFQWQASTHDQSPAATAIVTAGTSDAAVAREAGRTLRFHRTTLCYYFDVGVAGLWRLLTHIDTIRSHRVIIVVAGMDAALPSVVGGLLPQPIIAVPTSNGYGAARNGETALASCLTSCAPGVLVTNIDNGYGAACAALRILRNPSQVDPV